MIFWATNITVVLWKTVILAFPDSPASHIRKHSTINRDGFIQPDYRTIIVGQQ
jgi:hypothetical protein